jgi:diadenosine tetraphosphatase ApaH/serine/threonine PP2A family protein phosphatase
VHAPLPATDIGTFDRVALLADVHGNSWALEAALEAAADTVDAYCFLGCLTWGPRPVAVLDRAEAAGAPVFFLRGNGERAVLELADGSRPAEPPVDDWMVAAHGPAGVARLARFPPALTITVPGLGPVLLCHGSPRSDIELLTPDTSTERIEQACAGVAETVVVHGHTHLQYLRQVGARTIAGCGSVGLPYTDEPGAAYWTLLDADGVHPQRTGYDVDAAVAAVGAGDYPAATRYTDQLRRPPTPAAIVADAESKLFSD